MPKSPTTHPLLAVPTREDFPMLATCEADRLRAEITRLRRERHQLAERVNADGLGRQLAEAEKLIARRPKS